jgi:hypothetical protein
MVKKQTFKNFQEFHHLTKTLSESQTHKIVSSLTKAEQDELMKSYKEGGWEDLFLINKMDVVVDEIKESTGIDLFQIKYRIVNDKSYYMKKSQWYWIYDRLISEVGKSHKDMICYVMGDYEAVEDCGAILLHKKNH